MNLCLPLKNAYVKRNNHFGGENSNKITCKYKCIKNIFKVKLKHWIKQDVCLKAVILIIKIKLMETIICKALSQERVHVELCKGYM